MQDGGHHGCLCWAGYPNIMQLGCRLIAWWLCWPSWLRVLDCHVYALLPYGRRLRVASLVTVIVTML